MNRRGSILVSVLLLASLLAVLVAVAGSVQRAGYGASRAYVDGIRAELAFRGAVERVVAVAGPSLNLFRHGGVFRIEDVAVELLLRDEAARIDLNNAEPELIAGIFRVVGVDPKQAEVFAARIVDWRDDDDEPEEGGAEREQYRAVGNVDGPANRPFLHVAELARVLGIPTAVAAAVAPHVTVASGIEEINPLIADREVLLALPGTTEARVRDFLRARANYSGNFDALVGRLGSVEDYVTSDRSAAVRIEGRVRLGPRNERRFETVIAIVDGDSEPFRILQWDSNPPRTPRPIAEVR